MEFSPQQKNEILTYYTELSVHPDIIDGEFSRLEVLTFAISFILGGRSQDGSLRHITRVWGLLQTYGYEFEKRSFSANIAHVAVTVYNPRFSKDY